MAKLFVLKANFDDLKFIRVYSCSKNHKCTLLKNNIKLITSGETYKANSITFWVNWREKFEFLMTKVLVWRYSGN